MDPIEERSEEALLFGGGRVLASWQWNARDQNVLGVQPEIDRLQRDEAAHEQAGPHQQHQRQGHFDDDEHAAEPAAAEAAADPFAGILERFHHVAPGCLQCRHQPEEQRRHHRDEQAESEHRDVQPDDRLARDRAFGDERGDGFRPAVRKQAAESGAARREQHAFDQQLADDAPSAGAEGDANRHLSLARGRSREQHVGNVAARDEEEQSDRRSQCVQRGFELADDAVDPADGVHGELLRIVVGVDLGQAVRDDVHVRGGLLERHARFEPRLEHEVAAADVGIGAIQPDGPPEVRRQLGEPPRHDADERGWSAVEDEGLSQYFRIPVVLFQPHLVGHHEDGWRARSGIGRCECATEDRRNAEKREHVGGDDAALVELGALAGRQQHILAGAADDLFEDLVLLLIVEELGNLKGAAASRLS